jgi:hypothetical protein
MCRGFRTRSFSVAVVVKAYREPGRQLGGSGVAVVRRQFRSPPIMTDRGAAVMRGCPVSGLPDGGRCASPRGTGRSCVNGHPSRVLAVMPAPDCSRRSGAGVNTSAECAADRDQAKPRTDRTRLRKLVHRENALHRVSPLASCWTGGAFLAARTLGHAAAPACV